MSTSGSGTNTLINLQYFKEKKKKEKAGSHWEEAQKTKANKPQIAQITQMNDAQGGWPATTTRDRPEQKRRLQRPFSPNPL